MLPAYEVAPGAPFIPDVDAPYELTRYYLDALAPGSYLAVSHASSDIDAEPQEAAVKRYNSHSSTRIVLRSKAEVARFFDGLRLLEPGLVQVQRWQPGSAAPDAGEQIAAYAGLARKS